MENRSLFNIVLLGPPGCGKGTQAQLIMEKYGFDHISTGQLFRREMAAGTKLGLIAKELIDKGQLCPDDVTLNMLYQYLQTFPNSKGFILDGVPRTIQQARMMDGIGYEHVIPVSVVIYIKVKAQEVTRRILERGKISGRSDDSPGVIKKRIDNYFALTKPLESYYHHDQKHTIRRINGMKSIQEVFEDICVIIDELYVNQEK